MVRTIIPVGQDDGHASRLTAKAHGLGPRSGPRRGAPTPPAHRETTERYPSRQNGNLRDPLPWPSASVFGLRPRPHGVLEELQDGLGNDRGCLESHMGRSLGGHTGGLESHWSCSGESQYRDSGTSLVLWGRNGVSCSDIYYRSSPWLEIDVKPKGIQSEL